MNIMYEDDPLIKKYRHKTHTTMETCLISPSVRSITRKITNLIDKEMQVLLIEKAIFAINPGSITNFNISIAVQNLRKRTDLSEGKYWICSNHLERLRSLVMCRQRIEEYSFNVGFKVCYMADIYYWNNARYIEI